MIKKKYNDAAVAAEELGNNCDFLLHISFTRYLVTTARTFTSS